MKTLICFLILLSAQSKALDSPAKIENIDLQNSYSDDVLVVTFDQPLQRIDAKNLPIIVEPEIKCFWSWIDQYNLACNLNDYQKYEDDNYNYDDEKSLTVATQYIFKLNEGLLDIQNREVSSQSYAFNYKRPMMTGLQVVKWQSPLIPILWIKFNQKITQSDLNSRLFLTTNNQSIVLERVLISEVVDLNMSHSFVDQNRYILVKPSQNLDLNKDYRISITPGIRSTHGTLESISQTLEKPIRAIEDFKYLKYTCSDSKNSYKGPCYSDDRMHISFTSIFDKNSLHNCMNIDFSKVHINQLDNKSVLTIQSNANNQSIFADCWNELKDIFSRQLIKPKDTDLPKTKGMRPYLSINFQNHTLISNSEEIDLRVSSTNLDSYYVTYEQVNNEKINSSQQVVVENENDNDSILEKIQLPLPESQIYTLKGYVSILEKTQDGSQRIPFYIQKSPYQINIKQNLNSILVQVNEIDTAKAIAGAEISINYEGKVFTSVTDENGLSEIAIRDFVESSDFALTIKYGENLITYPSVHKFNNYIGKSDDTNWHSYDYSENSIYLFGISDKPLYRAGETVNYKLYIRQKKDTNYIIPNTDLSDFKIVLNSNQDSCYDFDDCNSLYALENPKLDKFGGISGKITLPKSIKNGPYSIQALFKNYSIESSSDLRFQVSDFKNSEYKLNLTSPVKHVKNNEPFPVVASAEYYSGGSITDGKGEIAGLLSTKSIVSEFPEYNGYYFGTSEYYDEIYYLKDLTYDANGAIKTNYTPPENSIKFGSLKLNAGLKPKAGEWNYSPDLVLPYRQQDYFLGLKFKSWSNKTNEDIQLETVLIDYLGQKHKAKSFEFFIKQQDNNQWTDYQALNCANKAKDSCVFDIQNKGSYKVKVIATKNKQNFVEEISLYVSDRAYHSGQSTKPLISIQSDKKSYKIGDKALISINFPEKINTALVTTERNNILDKWSLQTTSGFLEIELPITTKHAPGFDVTVLTQQNNSINRLESLKHISQTSLNIKVDEAKEDKLFEIKTDKKEYKPKQSIKLNIQSFSHLNSEFTVAVIDQSIVDLIGSKMHYDLTESNYNESKNYWDLYKNYQITAHYDNNHYKIKLKKGSDYLEYEYSNYYDDEDMVELSPVIATGSRIEREDIGAFPSEVKGQSKSDVPLLFSNQGNPISALIEHLKINPEDLRYMFAESAYFESAIEIDSDSDKSIDIALPDNIAEWKIIVLGTDESGKLEINDLSVKASKNIELRSTLPVQLTENDDFVAQYSVVPKKSRKVNIQSAIQATQQATVLNTKHVDFKKVKKLQSKTLELPVENVTQGNLNITALAKTKKDADGLFQTIPVRSNTTELSISQYGQFDTTIKKLNINNPEHASESANLSLVVSNSLMPYLQPVYDYMDDYAHACWEQQSAKAIVSAIQLESIHGLSQTEIESKKEQIDTIINNAIDFQAPNGGMTFFNAENDNVNLFLSLNTLSNFKFLQQLGYDIPKQVKNRLTQFINQIALNTENLPASIYRYKSNQLDQQILLKAVNYSNQDRTSIKDALENISELSLASLTQLLYFYKEDATNLKSILKSIRSQFYSNNKKYTLKDSGYSPWYLMPSNVKDHCELMVSLLDLDSDSISKDDLYKHINGILENRNNKGEFGNTLENSVCSQALFLFSQKYETSIQKVDYNLKLNDEISPINNGIVNTKVSLNNVLEISIENPSQTQTYFSSQLKFQVPSDSVKQQSIGFNIQREYFIFHEGNWIPAVTFNVGDWVKTRMTIHSPISRKFVAVSDPVPGAWLPTDPELARNMPVGMRESLKHFDNSGFFYERQLNPATTRFYADYLPAGSHRISYLSQIRSEGSFSAMPAIVEEMYDDENHANTESLIIDVSAE